MSKSNSVDRTATGRVRNPLNLEMTVLSVLDVQTEPLTTPEIAEGVLETGFKTTGKTFGTQVAVALGSLKAARRVRRPSRGLYAISAAGTKFFNANTVAA